VARAELPVYMVAYSGDRLTIDGRLEEPAWSMAPASADFAWVDAGDPAPVRSWFQALYTRQGLYFGCTFMGPKLPPRPLDPDLPRACEVFLDPEGRGRTYLEYAVSPEGVEHVVTWHGRLSMQAWDGAIGLRTRSAMTHRPEPDGSETIAYEILFPWRELQPLAPTVAMPPARGAAWRANFSRVEAGEVAGDYTWAPCGFYYLHTPDTFGWLVFRGEANDLRDPPALKRLPDDSTRISGGPRFRLFNRLYWARFPLLEAGGGDYWAVTKCSVSRLGPDGRERFTVTRADGLPQFIGSVAHTPSGLLVAGSGIGAGLALVAPDGKVRRPGEAEGYALRAPARVFALGPRSCLVAVGSTFRVFSEGRFTPAVEASGDIQAACALGGNAVVLGTATGVEVVTLTGAPVGTTEIAGGITSLQPAGEAAIGVSGKNGLYRVTADGACDYYPYPLRAKFDGVWVDSAGRAWAGHTGGLLRIDGRTILRFHEPSGASGFRVSSAAPLPGGGMAFLCTLPEDPWYQSSTQSPFLLIYRGDRWERVGLPQGLPGKPSAVGAAYGRVFLSSSAGVFELRR
jgi:hypothetical protein